MSSDNGLEMASQTVSDVSHLSVGAERGADNLMRDVSGARQEFGSNSNCFKDYDVTVSTALEKNGTLPMLSLGHAKNTFDKLDLDGSGDLTGEELLLARDHAGSRIEQSMLALLTNSFQDVRAAHESNKYIPWAEDKKGITLDDLNAKLKEGESQNVLVERWPGGKEQFVSTTTFTEGSLTDAEVGSKNAQRMPDEDAVNAKNFGRLAYEPTPHLGTENTLDDHGFDESEHDERGWPTFDRLSRKAEKDSQISACELPEWTVQKGQYLWMIAEQSLVDNGNCKPSVREINDMTNLIAQENNMHRNDYLKVGQRLRLPQTHNGKR